MRQEFSRLLQQVDPDGAFDIPMDDVVQGLDSANESKSDPVRFGPRAVVVLKRLYARFGIEDMPETMGELLGSLWYCKVLQSFAAEVRTDPANDAAWEAATVRTLKQHMPELLDSYLAYRTGDVERLKALHRTTMPLTRMSKHYDPGQGWSGNLDDGEQAKRQAGDRKSPA